ncbi:helix-turn-helix transcriptional regulator [Enterococcus ureilyticus]|uniref:helix-turn-helix domain-containing protein n=1 Tax=Enterococcus ureilyticus TaxID=1131292 RepID=UPI001A90D201|nr:helix-turn-helix transcriptional regulator [Enterococcus ureilyticus]MBO0445564.1 helix-turn-helix transcriptional regulator [Enterococcus ureilyticus]
MVVEDKRSSNRVSSQLKLIRQEKMLSKKGMAELLDTTYSTYCNYEYGNREPSLDEIVRISQKLNVTTDYLLIGFIQMNKKEVGARIKFIRMSLGLTMEEFGKKFDPKADKSLVSRWEKGVSKPNNDRLKRISEIGKVSMFYLLEGKFTSADIQQAEKGTVFEM